MLAMNNKGDIFDERRKKDRRQDTEDIKDERRIEERRKKDINSKENK